MPRFVVVLIYCAFLLTIGLGEWVNWNWILTAFSGAIGVRELFKGITKKDEILCI